MTEKQNYIIEFSGYLVLGFLRIENVYALLKKNRAYSAYLEIPKMLGDYILSPKDKGKQDLQNHIDKLSKAMYVIVLQNIPLGNINIGKLTGSNIDKLNFIIQKEYKIDTKYFFASFASNDQQVNDDNIDKQIEEQIELFIKFYDILQKRSNAPDVKINKNIMQDITICSIISATEFTNAIHHIYISYYKYKKGNSIRSENIHKAVMHLKRAILDIKEALNLSNQKNIKFEHVQDRLEKIYNVGQNIK